MTQISFARTLGLWTRPQGTNHDKNCRRYGQSWHHIAADKNTYLSLADVEEVTVVSEATTLNVAASGVIAAF